MAHGAALAMVAWLFVQANSVTAQSCFLLASALLIATSIPAIARKRWLVHLLAVILIAIPFATLFLGVGGSALKGMGRDSTLTGRTDIWARVIALVHNPVVGTGFESFWLGKRLEAMQLPDQAGDLAAVMRAIRAGASYANMHTPPNFPGGEIRGQIQRNDD